MSNYMPHLSRQSVSSTEITVEIRKTSYGILSFRVDCLVMKKGVGRMLPGGLTQAYESHKKAGN